MTGQSEVGEDLYELLMQWFAMFPEYATNDFFVFGESYGGKYVPTISKKIHDENQSSAFKINFKGLAVGNGGMSPPDSFIYAEFLYQVVFEYQPPFTLYILQTYFMFFRLDFWMRLIETFCSKLKG